MFSEKEPVSCKWVSNTITEGGEETKPTTQKLNKASAYYHSSHFLWTQIKMHPLRTGKKMAVLQGGNKWNLDISLWEVCSSEAKFYLNLWTPTASDPLSGLY